VILSDRWDFKERRLKPGLALVIWINTLCKYLTLIQYAKIWVVMDVVHSLSVVQLHREFHPLLYIMLFFRPSPFQLPLRVASEPRDHWLRGSMCHRPSHNSCSTSQMWTLQMQMPPRCAVTMWRTFTLI
jgi:hypothetical protein